jgi:hypothetical protein
MHVMVAAKHDESAYNLPDEAVKRHGNFQLLRPTTSSSAGAMSRDVASFDAFIQYRRRCAARAGSNGGNSA